MTVPTLVSIQRLNELLNDRLEELLGELIGGRKRGREWVAASTSEGGPGDSLSVGLYAHKRGKWFHHAAGAGGDALELICYMRTRGDKGRGIQWAKDFLGGNIPDDTDEQRRQRIIRQRQHAAKEKRDREAGEGSARYHWFKKSVPLEKSPAWEYLDRRLMGNLARLGHVPGCLRYIAELHNSQLNKPMPALVASIVNRDGQMIGMHRTFLVERPEGWDRLRGEDGVGRDGKELMGKKVLGSWKGGTIRLWAGQRINDGTGEIKRGVGWNKLRGPSSILLCEGIETGLSLALIQPHRRIVSAVGIAGFADAELADAFRDVTIAAENDGGNKQTAAAIERARQVHTEAGRKLSIIWPPEGFDDWNTALREVVRGRAA